MMLWATQTGLPTIPQTLIMVIVFWIIVSYLSWVLMTRSWLRVEDSPSGGGWEGWHRLARWGVWHHRTELSCACALWIPEIYQRQWIIDWRLKTIQCLDIPLMTTPRKLVVPSSEYLPPCIWQMALSLRSSAFSINPASNKIYRHTEKGTRYDSYGRLSLCNIYLKCPLSDLVSRYFLSARFQDCVSDLSLV